MIEQEPQAQNQAPASEETIQPICGAVVLMFPNGTFQSFALDPSANNVARAASPTEILVLCKMVLIHNELREAGGVILRGQQPALVVPNNGGNPLMNNLRKIHGRLRGA